MIWFERLTRLGSSGVGWGGWNYSGPSRSFLGDVVIVHLIRGRHGITLRTPRPNCDKNSISLSEYLDFMGFGTFFPTTLVLKKKPPSHRNSVKDGI